MSEVQILEKEDIDEEELDEIDISDAFQAKIVVFNDDHNSIEHVIMLLMTVCKLKQEDAVNKTLEIHNNGKSLVKFGEYEELKNMVLLLGEGDLTVEIQ